MSRRRTRPDTSGKPGYITPEGYRRFEEEADRLWNVDRPKMAKAVQVAAAEGDRSENAEYQYSKQRLAAIDRRLRFLGTRLKVLTIVDEKPPDDGRVYFGSWVTIEDEDGNEQTYRLVGPDEIDADKRWISMDSPVGKSLLSREVGDEITLRRPKGEAICEITEVRNGPPKSWARGRLERERALLLEAEQAEPCFAGRYLVRRPTRSGPLSSAAESGAAETVGEPVAIGDFIGKTARERAGPNVASARDAVGVEVEDDLEGSVRQIVPVIGDAHAIGTYVRNGRASQSVGGRSLHRRQPRLELS